MRRVIRRSCRAPVLLLWALAAGCRAPGEKGMRPTLGDAPAAAAVRALWASHGGADAWRRQAAVRFAYSLEEVSTGRRTSFPEVAFRLDDFLHVWVARESAEAPAVETLDGRLQVEDDAAVDFALNSIRFLFSLPLASTAGRWELRQLLAPPDLDLPPVLELVPLEPPARLGPCRLFLDARTGLLRRIVCAARHPFAGKEPIAVEFDDYVEVSGMRIARTRRSGLLREEVTGIRFLSREEADARYPPPGGPGGPDER